jgi:hypothetical protein
LFLACSRVLLLLLVKAVSCCIAPSSHPTSALRGPEAGAPSPPRRLLRPWAAICNPPPWGFHPPSTHVHYIVGLHAWGQG